MATRIDRRCGGRVRVLIVDDSALMRRLLTDLLGSSPEIEVVGAARDGREAVSQAARLKPDVITLDVEMPEVSGLEALPLSWPLHEVAGGDGQRPDAGRGRGDARRRSSWAPFDFFPKPERNQLTEMRASRDLLVGKVLAAAQSEPPARGPRRVRPSGHASAAASQPRRRPASRARRALPRTVSDIGTGSGSPFAGSLCVVIGISTGGPQALEPDLPAAAPRRCRRSWSSSTCSRSSPASSPSGSTATARSR